MSRGDDSGHELQSATGKVHHCDDFDKFYRYCYSAKNEVIYGIFLKKLAADELFELQLFLGLFRIFNLDPSLYNYMISS